MPITSANALIKQMLGKVFRHTFKVVVNQHALLALAHSCASSIMSSICDMMGRTSILDRKPVGRIILLNLSLAHTFLIIARVAETYTNWGIRSLKFIEAQGRLSRHDGKRKPCSVSVILRERCPLHAYLDLRDGNMASSMKHRKSVGK